MNWTMILIGFSLAVLMGAGLAALLAQMRPEWSLRRRGLVAASFLPAVTLVATFLGLVWIWTLEDPGGGNMRDLAAGLIATVGLGAALLAFFGGLIGALLAQHRRLR
jgi:ABC-type sugar transport system permease subunit